MKDIDSLAHTKWRCQYHIVFAPKYRRQIIYGKYKAAIGKILRRICERCEGVEIIEANACEDHIHMLVTIPPKLSVSKFMGILKGKSSLMIFDQFANLKYKYGNRHFWCRGYYVDTFTYFYGHYFQGGKNREGKILHPYLYSCFFELKSRSYGYFCVKFRKLTWCKGAKAIKKIALIFCILTIVISPSEFAFSVGYGSIGLRGCQRSENCHRKHQTKKE